MNLRQLLTGFLAGVLYPLWLLAGAVDYLCHRRTDIGHTSGVVESWLHVAQFGSLLMFLIVASLLQITLGALIVMISAVVLHTLLSMLDVSYTQGRRYISTPEQLVHGFMDVIPLVAVALIAMLNWRTVSIGELSLRWVDAVSAGPSALLLGSYLVLAGLPVLEELRRTSRQSATTLVP